MIARDTRALSQRNSMVRVKRKFYFLFPGAKESRTNQSYYMKVNRTFAAIAKKVTYSMFFRIRKGTP